MHSEEERVAMQRALDKAWDWFVVQEKPKSQRGHSCMYRGPKGCRCAVGLLIPDNEYNPGLEGATAVEMKQHCPSLEQYPDGFLMDLQGAHDTWYDIGATATANIMKQLTHLSVRYGLVVPS